VRAERTLVAEEARVGPEVTTWPLEFLDVHHPIAFDAERAQDRPVQLLSGHGLDRIAPDLRDVHASPASGPCSRPVRECPRPNAARGNRGRAPGLLLVGLLLLKGLLLLLALLLSLFVLALLLVAFFVERACLLGSMLILAPLGVGREYDSCPCPIDEPALRCTPRGQARRRRSNACFPHSPGV